MYASWVTFVLGTLAWMGHGDALCPDGMARVESGTCMDRYEAPNRKGELPLVMYSMVDGQRWCNARGKRLCYDDEWMDACRHPEVRRGGWPYGKRHEPGACNDNRTAKAYSPAMHYAWPKAASAAQVNSLKGLWKLARVLGGSRGEASVEHMRYLYQAVPSGSKPRCVTGDGVYDLSGNVEEWVMRRNPEGKGFTGRLMGRFWGQAFTCDGGVSNHGDAFRFYETGFRCCCDVGQCGTPSYTEKPRRSI